MTLAATKSFLKTVGSLLAVGLLSATLAAQTPAATRYDNQIQTTVTQKLAKSQFSDVKSTVEDGIVTLTGTVDLYQRKLDAAKLARKTASVQGVRNLITVAGPNVPDEQLEQKLATKLRYVRVGYDNTFDYFALGREGRRCHGGGSGSNRRWPRRSPGRHREHARSEGRGLEHFGRANVDL